MTLGELLNVVMWPGQILDVCTSSTFTGFWRGTKYKLSTLANKDKFFNRRVISVMSTVIKLDTFDANIHEIIEFAFNTYMGEKDSDSDGTQTVSAMVIVIEGDEYLDKEFIFEKVPDVVYDENQESVAYCV